MSFFVVISNSVKEISFSYLEGRKRDLNDTVVTPARQKIQHFNRDKQGAQILAKEIMHTNVITLPHDATVEYTHKIFSKYNIHHAPVLEDGHVVGIISATDIHGVEETLLLKDESIEQKMAQTVLCVSSGTPMQHVIEVFLHESIHALPVLDDQFYLVGMISQNDILKWILKNKKYLK